VTIALGLAAVVLLGLGFVLQQRAAWEAPPADSLSFRLFADLIGKPVWLAGVVAMVGGQVLGALALGGGDGNVSLVEPLLTTNLLFALVLAQLLSAQQLAWREWGGALLLIAGVAAFIVAAQPGSGIGLIGQPRNWIFIGVIAVIVGATVSLARRTAGAARASLLATGAGLLFGVQDGFTRRAMLVLDGGPLRLLESWLPTRCSPWRWLVCCWRRARSRRLRCGRPCPRSPPPSPWSVSPTASAYSGRGCGPPRSG
jgi:hypothetical protein